MVQKPNKVFNDICIPGPFRLIVQHFAMNNPFNYSIPALFTYFAKCPKTSDSAKIHQRSDQRHSIESRSEKYELS